MTTQYSKNSSCHNIEANCEEMIDEDGWRCGECSTGYYFVAPHYKCCDLDPVEYYNADNEACEVVDTAITDCLEYDHN